MVHSATLTGKTSLRRLRKRVMSPSTRCMMLESCLGVWGRLSPPTYDTTPDGRIGWYEYFVRQGFPTYVVDQVSRARSGFDISVHNNVRIGA